MNADDTIEYLDRFWLRTARQVMAVTALATYVCYLVYRYRYTISTEAPIFGWLVFLAEVHGFFSLFFYFFQIWAPIRRVCPPPSGRFTVDIFITTYNEDLALLRQTARAAIDLRYPHETYLCDDGRRPAVAALARELGCGYITRSDNTHAKAGNWNNAYAQTTGDLILTLDADHVVQPQLLERTLGYFEDPRVALVQVPQQYHNLDSVQHRVDWDERRMYGEQDVFFDLVMPGKDTWNSAFFCGTGAVLRREALVPHGGIITGSITEDMHTAIVLHSEGWKSVYVNEVLVTGLAPTDVSSFLKQRLRWAEGNLKIIFDINPLTCRGLSIPQRISYFASMYHWTVGVPKLVFYLSPPWMLVSGTFPIAPFTSELLTIYLANLAAMSVAYKLSSRGRGRLLMDEFFNMLNTFTLLQALGRLLLQGKKMGAFVVTSKKGGDASTGAVMPHLVLLAASGLAINWSLMGLGFGVTEDWFGAGIAMFWTVYNMSLVAMVVRLATRPRQKRDTSRFRTAVAVTSRGVAGASAVGVTIDLSEGGCRLHWPEAMPLGARRRLDLHLSGGVLTLDVEVVKAFARTNDGWWPIGVRFVAPSTADVDALNDAIYDTVVPELLHGLRRSSMPVRLMNQVRLTVQRRFAPRAIRRAWRVPVRLVAPTGRAIFGTSRDTSASGISLVASAALPVGAVVSVDVEVPGRRQTLVGEVVRCRPISEATRRKGSWDIGLRVSADALVAVVDEAERQVA
ncbi:MAG TPA: glycosyltransferase [Luteitalea sp.]|nr:glycosyltransferase [Luteitalea sp.]